MADDVFDKVPTNLAAAPAPARARLIVARGVVCRLRGRARVSHSHARGGAVQGGAGRGWLGAGRYRAGRAGRGGAGRGSTVQHANGSSVRCGHCGQAMEVTRITTLGRLSQGGLQTQDTDCGLCHDNTTIDK